MEALTFWVIYDHPRDFPAHFVLRRWHVIGGRQYRDRLGCLCATIEEARAHVPPGLFLWPWDNGDPSIAECYF